MNLEVKNIKKILVVKMHQHGDVILSSAAIDALHQTYPDATIDVYLYKDTLPMLSEHPYINNFITFERGWKDLPFFKRLQKEFYTLLKIRQGDYDLVINLTNGDRGAIVSLLSGCDYSYAIDSVGRGLIGKRYCYTKTAMPFIGVRHEVKRLFDVIKLAGVNADPGPLSIRIPGESKNKILGMLNSEGLKPKEYVLLAPLSRLFYKCLHPKQIAELIIELHNRGEKVIISGSSLQKELDYIAQVKSNLGSVPVVDFSGKMTLKDLSALIDMSKCMITVDSVPVHIASALQAPVVALYGPTSPEEWGPWMNPNARVVKAATNNIPFELSNDEILKAYSSLLKIENMSRNI